MTKKTEGEVSKTLRLEISLWSEIDARLTRQKNFSEFTRDALRAYLDGLKSAPSLMVSKEVKQSLEAQHTPPPKRGGR